MNADERFLPIYEFAGEDNRKITQLDEFAEAFLKKCDLGRTISRYMVLLAGEQKLMIMRPYQVYAVQHIVQCINEDNGNGFIWHTTGMRRWLNAPEFFEPTPEQTLGMPWDRLKEVAKTHGSRGPGSNKVIFAKKMCGVALRYELERAAAHPACRSATAFRDGLVELGGKNLPLQG